MAKEKLSFKDGNKICLSVKENNLKDFYKKIIDIATDDLDYNNLIELRLDFLINKKVKTEDIIKVISSAKKVLNEEFDTQPQFIATIRSFTNGGNCILDEKTYLDIITLLYEKASVEAIDIDYCFYEKKSSAVKKLFSGKKSLIITYTCRDKSLSENEYDEIIKDLIKTPAYVIRIITKAFSFDDCLMLMDEVKKFSTDFEKSGKVVSVISLGKLGIISRLYPEYTGSMITYINNEQSEPVSIDGEISKVEFDKLRKQFPSVKEFLD